MARPKLILINSIFINKGAYIIIALEENNPTNLGPQSKQKNKHSIQNFPDDSQFP